MVTPVVVREMCALLQPNASFVFRRLMTLLIPRVDNWAACVGSQGILERFREQVSAAYGKKTIQLRT